MKSNNSNKNPWLALKTYEEEDQHKFKGRDKDVDNIVTLIEQNECVICYAASGEGKSSLINAGLCPRLKQENYFPIKIFFTQEEQNLERLDFDKVVSYKIESCLKSYNNDIDENVSKLENDIEKKLLSNLKVEFKRQDKYKDVELPDSLWWTLRTGTIQTALGKQCVPVVIFDQFEEIFRTGWKDSFFKWMEILMKDKCYDNNIDDNLIPTRKLFKVLFSMRHEYVGELDYWCSQRTYIPQMMRNRYFLKPLTKEQSLSIIKGQEYHDENIANKTISCAGEIIDVAKKDKNNQSDEVSAIVLSLICKLLYDKWSDDIDYSIDKAQYKEVIYNYYLETMKEIGISDDARFNIEEALVSETRTKHRIPVSDKRLRRIDFDSFKDKLKDEHIVKIDTIGNTEYVEFIHDRLVEAIYDKHKEEAEKREYDKKIEELKKKRKRNMFFITLSLVILVIVSVLFINAKKNEKNFLITQAKLITAEAEKLVENGDVYDAVRLLRYVIKNNKEAKNIAEMERVVSLLYNYDIPDFVIGTGYKNAAFNPKDKSYITTKNKDVATIWSSKNEMENSFDVRDAYFNSVDYHPSGEYIIIASDKGLYVRSVSNNKMIQETIILDEYLNSAKFSHNGEYIMAFSSKHAYLFKVDDKKFTLKKEIQSSKDSKILSAMLIDDGKRIIVAEKLFKKEYKTETIHIAVSDTTNKVSSLFMVHDKSVKDAFFHPNGNFFTISDGKLWIWRFYEDKFERKYECTDTIHDVDKAVISPSGKYFATIDNENAIIWSYKDGKCEPYKEIRCGRNINSLVFGHDDTNIIVTYYDNTPAGKFSIDNLKTIPQFSKEKSDKVAISPNGKYIATTNGKIVKLWNAEDDKCIDTFENTQTINEICFSPDNMYIIISSMGETRIRSVNKRKSWDTIIYGKEYIFSRQNKHIALGNGSSKIVIWSMEEKKCVDALELGRGKWYKDFAFSSDDEYLIVVSNDSLRRWSISEKRWEKAVHIKTDYSTTSVVTDFILNYKTNDNNNMVLYLIHNEKECKSLDVNYKKIDNVTIDHRNGLIAAVLEENYKDIIRVWSEKGEHLYDISDYDIGFGKPIFSKNGKYIFKKGSYKMSYLFQTDDGRCVNIINADGYGCDVSDKGDIILVKGKKLRLYSNETTSSKLEYLIEGKEITDLTKEEKEKYFLN